MNVDYSLQITNNYYSIVFPLKHNSEMWFFIDPFSFNVWIGSILSAPIYLLAMGLADYLFNGFADWGTVTDFVIRNALFEHTHFPLDKQVYQKILIFIWSWCMSVLVQSYAGNLTAMLTRPKLQQPIGTLEELLGQIEASWIITDPVVAFALKTSENGSVLKGLGDSGITVPPNAAYDCFPSEIYLDGMFGSICNIGSIQLMMSYDYNLTGKCNYYIIEDKFLTSGGSMAFQVVACAVW